MEKRSKDLLRNLVTELRCTLLGTWDDTGEPLRGDLDRELERLGISPDGTLTPLDALPNATTAERRARRVAEAQLASLPAEERSAARREIVERAGYTWVNRLLALRAMEARGLIDETLRANPAYDGLSDNTVRIQDNSGKGRPDLRGPRWASSSPHSRSFEQYAPVRAYHRRSRKLKIKAGGLQAHDKSDPG